MQFVEQRLELVVADIVTSGSRGRLDRLGGDLRRLGRDRRRHELALAVQLVEQRLELGVADLVASGSRGRFCNGGGRRFVALQSIQQLLELVVGDIAGGTLRGRFRRRRRLGWRNGRRRRLHRFRGLGALGLGQAGKGRQQLGRRRGRFGLLAYLVEHRVDRIQRLQHHIHQFGADAPLALAQDIEDVFRNVAAFHQRVQLEEAGTALDRMEPTENGIEQVHIVRPALQLDQLLGQLLENLAGLNQEVLEDFFIGVEAHSAAPRDVLLERIGRTAVLPEIPARLSGPTSARPPGSPA